MSKLIATLFTLAIATFLAATPPLAQSVSSQFRIWLANDLWPEAQQRGISQPTFNAAFSGVEPNLELPDLVLPGAKKKVPKQQRQAEFRSPAAYFAPNIISGVVNGGKPLFHRHAATLQRLERETGVPGHVAIAIWGRESAFGKAKIPHNAFEVLATKAFLSTRKDYFRGEVLAALEIVEKKGIRPDALRSSWAGALGQPQFMPSSYLAYARSGDGDRIADIWNSEADTLASITGYLAEKGWVRGRDWGFEVTLPAKVSCALEGPDQGRKISDWEKLGIKRVSGRPFPAHERGQTGFLMLPAGRYGPAFIVTPNFFVIKEYNKSDLYALFVGHSGDRIRYGSAPFSTAWGDVGGMYRSDIAVMQRALEAQGYDVGGADGLPGFKTRRSIGDWQLKNGLKPDCFPTKSLLSRFR